MAISPALRELMAQKANKFKTSGTNAKKLKEGRTVVRVIAPQPGQTAWCKEGPLDCFREAGVFWIKGSLDGKPTAVVGDSEICYGTPSPIRAAVDMAIANAYDEDGKKLFESWKARATVLVNMIDRADNSVGLFDLPKGVWGKIMDLWNLYAEQDYDIFDSLSGLDLAISRSGTGLNTQYDVQAMPMLPGKGFAPVTADQIAKAVDPDEFIKVNYFRGEDQKALNAIAQFAGIIVPQIGAPVTPTAALTSQSATVADAPPAVDPAEQARIAAALAQQQAAQLAANQAAQAAQLAALQAQQQVAQPVVQPVVAQPAVQPVVQPAEIITPTTGLTDLSQAAQDELFRQLNAIT